MKLVWVTELHLWPVAREVRNIAGKGDVTATRNHAGVFGLWTSLTV